MEARARYPLSPVRPKHRGARRAIQAEARFGFHFVNAYEDGDEVVADICTFPDAGIVQDLYLERLRAGKPVTPAHLERFRISRASREVAVERLVDDSLELPQINYARCNERPYRYAWGVGVGSGWLDQIVKADVQERSSAVWAEDGCYPGEPVFVAAPGGEREDEGVLLSVVLGPSGRSFLLILDAGSLEELARAEVPTTSRSDSTGVRPRVAKPARPPGLPATGHNRRVVGRVSSERFVGREDYLAALGGGGTVLIVGDAGVGKSRLVAELERHATGDGKLALIGECLELTDGELPYAPIVSALRSTLRDGGALAGLSPLDLRELARLWPELSPGEAPAPADDGEGSSKGRLFSLLLQLLDRLADEREVLFVLEDLHWADHSTRDFLAFLVRAGRSESLTVVMTLRGEDVHRDHPVRAFVTELSRVRGVRRLELAPFTREELALQVEGITGERPSRELIERLFERSEGNAFYTEELLAAGEGTPLPNSLRDLLLLRIERLPDPHAAARSRSDRGPRG